MIAQICASALSEVENGGIWYQKRVEPEPGLAGIVAGLVHHPPLAAEQVLLRREALEVAAVGEEEQRLREVRLVEAVGRDRARRRGRRCAPSRAAPPSSPAPARRSRGTTGARLPTAPRRAPCRTRPSSLLRARRARLVRGQRGLRAEDRSAPGSRAGRARMPSADRSGSGRRSGRWIEIPPTMFWPAPATWV